MTDITITAPSTTVADDVILKVNGYTISGWTDVKITRGCEQIPNSFEIGLTAENPTDGSQVIASAGDPCTVMIGRDTVITGYIDRETVRIDAQGDRCGIIGRGRCQDLVDCSAVYPSGQIAGANIQEIAGKLADFYGITAYLVGQNIALKTIPQFNLNLGETPQEIIERIATYDGLLYYEDEDGDLVLSQVGVTQAASGFAYGQNVLAWSVTNAMDQRFSQYVCATVSIAAFSELGNDGLTSFKAYDPNVLRPRIKYLIAESVSGSESLNMVRALWEAARQAGRGTSVTLTADSWRDSGGTLWTPNTLASVTGPGLNIEPGKMLCISEVILRYDDEGGKVADITLMPPEAFAPQPIVLQPTPFATGEAPP